MFFNIIFWGLLVLAIVCVYQICVADFRRRIIPDAFLFPLMLIGLVLSVFYRWPVSITMGVIGAVFGFLMSAGIGFVFDWQMRRKNPDIIAPIGMGDIKLISIGGLWLGTTGLAIALIGACFGGALWARVKHVKYIPFAPFFVISGILALIIVRFLV